MECCEVIRIVIRGLSWWEGVGRIRYIRIRGVSRGLEIVSERGAVEVTFVFFYSWSPLCERS